MLGHRLAIWIRGRIHPVDHPVVAVRLEERVLALHLLTVEDRDDLVLAELLGLEGPAVPDPHLAGAVLALGDVALELEVLERVVLGVDCEAVLLGVLRDAARERERDERSVVLQPQVPVEPAGVVLLDHEAVALRGLLSLAAPRLGRPVERALALVFRDFLAARHGELMVGAARRADAPARTRTGIFRLKRPTR